jgi:hypothetical protein
VLGDRHRNLAAAALVRLAHAEAGTERSRETLCGTGRARASVKDVYRRPGIAVMADADRL